MRTLFLLLLLPLAASAGDRLSFITVDQDNQYTALSTITCKIRASRLSPTLTYSGTVTFEWQTPNPSQVGYSITVPYEVSPQAPTYSESSDYRLTATLVTWGRKAPRWDALTPQTSAIPIARGSSPARAAMWAWLRSPRRRWANAPR
jgi:hypothetical protein